MTPESRLKPATEVTSLTPGMSFTRLTTFMAESDVRSSEEAGGRLMAAKA